MHIRGLAVQQPCRLSAQYNSLEDFQLSIAYVSKYIHIDRLAYVCKLCICKICSHMQICPCVQAFSHLSGITTINLHRQWLPCEGHSIYNLNISDTSLHHVKFLNLLVLDMVLISTDPGMEKPDTTLTI